VAVKLMVDVVTSRRGRTAVPVVLPGRLPDGKLLVELLPPWVAPSMGLA
jgi:hypothetical protein